MHYLGGRGRGKNEDNCVSSNECKTPVVFWTRRANATPTEITVIVLALPEPSNLLDFATHCHFSYRNRKKVSYIIILRLTHLTNLNVIRCG